MKGYFQMKKVLFILVDALVSEILKKGFEARCIPALQFLQQQGSCWHDCVTVFPTMTASIMTTGFKTSIIVAGDDKNRPSPSRLVDFKDFILSWFVRLGDVYLRSKL
jgi:hypothetical protein